MSTPPPEESESTPAMPPRERSQAWFGRLVPDLAERAESFATDLNVLDEELVELFLGELTRATEGIRAGTGALDEAGIREHAHTLQGMGGAVGAPEVSVLGEEVSSAAKARNFARCAELLEALEGWRREWQAPTRDESAGPGNRFPNLEGRILVVDDEAANRKFMKKLLRECGAEVLLAEDGETALEHVRTHRPDVALVDVMMPGIEGYDVCDRIRRDPDLNQTSVIMVTAKSTAADVEHAFEKGAFDYIRKPFHSRELVARVRNALLLKRNTDALEAWKTRLSRELEVAGTLQAQLFDPTPVYGSRLEFQAAYRPSEHIGGDMFDYQISETHGHHLLYVADVAGHGVASALISTLLKGLVNEILQAAECPELYEIGNTLHHRFRQCVADPELYATLMLVRLHPDTHRVESLSCGHPPPLVLNARGEAAPGAVPEKGGMPVGMLPSGMGDPYTAEDLVCFDLPGDCSLYLYTDGLLEARNPAGEECGPEGLEKALKGTRFLEDPWRDPNTVLDILAEAGFDIAADDCSLLRLTRVPDEAVLTEGHLPPTLEAAAEAGEHLEHRLQAEGWPRDAAGMARLLVTEHCVNAVRHGRANHPIHYRIRRVPDQDRVLLTLRDPGRAWNRDQARRTRPGTEEEFLDHGRGLDLIDSIAPLQRHYRRDRHNVSLYLLAPRLPVP